MLKKTKMKRRNTEVVSERGSIDRSSIVGAASGSSAAAAALTHDKDCWS